MNATGPSEMCCRIEDAFAEADPGLSESCDHRRAEARLVEGGWRVCCDDCGARFEVVEGDGPEAVDGFTFRQMAA